VLSLVVIRSFEEFVPLLVEARRKTDVERGLWRSCMVRRVDLLDTILNRSSKPVSACQRSRRAAAEQNHHKTDESNQRIVKCAVIAKAVGTALHNTDRNTHIVSRAKRYAKRTDFVFGRLLGVKGFRKHVGISEFVEDGCLCITSQKLEEPATDRARNGHILITRAGTVGRMAIGRTTHTHLIILQS
jgi:hypothetical protein